MQIRRTTANSTVTGLVAGQLVYAQNGTGTSTTNSGLLYIGQPSDGASRIIGGTYAFGVLTPNQAIVANSTSWVDKLQTANLTVLGNATLNSCYLTINGTAGQLGNVIVSNATGGIYWGSVAAGGVTITMGNGLTSTQSPLTSAGTMSANIDGSMKFTSGAMGVNAAATSGLVANATGVWVQVANGLVVNATGFIAVNASPGISVNSTGTFVNLATTSGLSTTSGLTTVAANGISLTAAGLNVLAGVGTVSNSTGHHVLAPASSGLVANATGTWVAAANGLNLTAAGVNVLGPASSGITSNSTGIWLAVNSSQFVLTSGGLTHNATGNVTLQDLTCSGNLIVSGTLTTIDSTSLTIKDNFVQLADGLATTTTFLDNVDAGLFIKTGNTQPNNFWSGLARLAGATGGSTNTNPVFRIFATDTVPGATTLAGSITQGTLEAYLSPYSNNAGGAFVVNSSAMAFVSNSTVSLSISGTNTSITTNTLTVAGVSTFTTPLAVSNIAGGTDGYILQTATGTSGAFYGVLDGGTFT